MRRLAVLALVPVVLVLASCSSGPEALNECTTVVAEHLGVPVGEVDVVGTKKSLVGSYDWQGRVGEATFQCASPDGALLTTAIVFGSDGTPEVLVARTS